MFQSAGRAKKVDSTTSRQYTQSQSESRPKVAVRSTDSKAKRPEDDSLHYHSGGPDIENDAGYLGDTEVQYPDKVEEPASEDVSDDDSRDNKLDQDSYGTMVHDFQNLQCQPSTPVKDQTSSSVKIRLRKSARKRSRGESTDLSDSESKDAAFTPSKRFRRSAAQSRQTREEAPNDDPMEVDEGEVIGSANALGDEEF